MTIRAKFCCSWVRKYKGVKWDFVAQTNVDAFSYEYEFQAVSDGSEENKKFFLSTPDGSLSLSSVRDDLFVPGQSYYLDFIPASD